MAHATRVSRDPTSRPAADIPPPPRKRPSRIVIEDLFPVLDCGRYRVKRCVGDTVRVSATIFRDGHERIEAVVRYRAGGAGRWRESPLSRVDAERGGDRWSGEFRVEELGRASWHVLAWTDRFGTWQEELERKLAAGQQDIASELAEGAAMLTELIERAGAGADGTALAQAREGLLDGSLRLQERRRLALDPQLAALARRSADRGDQASSAVQEVEVERVRARFASWYELFPRSWGGFEGVRRQLPALAELGFDVLYMPPIHPIGVSERKGPNDTANAAPEDPGSPYAIGAAEGGHDAIHPDLGNLEDFARLVADARSLGIEVALDFAVQSSADHPWLVEHPEWFFRRPDGTLKYAENPPKRYVDIYNLDFDTEDWQGLWEALRDVVLFWVGHGVRAFRVDNPHTKPLAFWEWLIDSVRRVEPETIFLSEAFTRSAKLNALAKAGFSQSYTYFTWKNSTWELREYVEELARPPVSDYLRPNLFVNTPDILSSYLQGGGPGAFAVRLLLAATLSPSYGIYSGFESFESTPRQEGSEEYLDSEKYQLRERTLDGPLLPRIGRLNAIRREHPALQRFDNIAFLPVENDALIAYAKREGDETILVVANVDPRAPQEGVVVVPGDLGLPPLFLVEDLLDGERYSWRLGRNYVRLDPAARPGHVLLAGV
jgi:starch synthase (maltosyl-transferring)